MCSLNWSPITKYLDCLPAFTPYICLLLAVNFLKQTLTAVIATAKPHGFTTLPTLSLAAPWGRSLTLRLFV